MIKPELKNLPLSAYNFLDKLGLLQKLYPESTRNWKTDCPNPNPIPKEDLGKFLKIAAKCPFATIQ